MNGYRIKSKIKRFDTLPKHHFIPDCSGKEFYRKQGNKVVSVLASGEIITWIHNGDTFVNSKWYHILDLIIKRVIYRV